MTTEEKAKAYDKALEIAKAWCKLDCNDLCNADLEILFPELKESKDERIRKNLLGYIKGVNEREVCKETLNEWIDWLEKQGEHNKWKPSKDEMDALYGLAYITNEMDDRKDVAITKLYQDLKREFFEGASYENIFPSSPVDSDINIEKQGEQKDINPTLLEKEKMDNAFTKMMFKGKTALEAIKEEKVDNAIKVEQKPYGQKEECFNCQFNYAGHCKGYCELKKQGDNPADVGLAELGKIWEEEQLQVDGFDTELDALLKKYEHLSKKELQEPLEFYLDVIKNDLDIVREEKPKWTEEDEKMMEFCCDYLDETQQKWLKSLKQRMQ